MAAPPESQRDRTTVYPIRHKDAPPEDECPDPPDPEATAKPPRSSLVAQKPTPTPQTDPVEIAIERMLTQSFDARPGGPVAVAHSQPSPLASTQTHPTRLRPLDRHRSAPGCASLPGAAFHRDSRTTTGGPCLPHPRYIGPRPHTGRRPLRGLPPPWAWLASGPKSTEGGKPAEKNAPVSWSASTVSLHLTAPL